METVAIKKKEVEFLYRGVCPKCGFEKSTSKGLNKSFDAGMKILCDGCKTIFEPSEYTEAIYQTRKF